MVQRDLETISCDVLVIGSGAAGLRAAIEARRSGARVLVISKSTIGGASCTLFAGGSFRAAIEGLTEEEHYRLTLESGKGMNDRELVKTLVSDAPSRVLEMEKMGMHSNRVHGELFCQGKPFVWGLEIIRTLRSVASDLGVEFLPYTFAIDLFLDGETVVGCLVYHKPDHKFFFILSGSIVLATGGAGGLYMRRDHPAQINGDGYALAYRAGARLRDMEFVQFYPLTIIEGKRMARIIPPLLADVGRLVNQKGEGILRKHNISDKPVAIVARDKLSQAIYRECCEGGDTSGWVLMDLRHLEEADWKINPLAASSEKVMKKKYKADQVPLRVSPAAHHTMGGVVIGREGETNVPGLFAAGEVVGGVHGANRMGGNALSDTVVFGARAGSKAAQYALGRELGPTLAKTALSYLDERLQGPPSAKEFSSVDLSQMRESVGRLLWGRGGIIRMAEGLKEGLNHLDEIEAKLNEGKGILSSRFPSKQMELVNIICVSRMIMESALRREESRGAHFRSDYPATDDTKWLGNIFIQKSDEKMKFDFVAQG